MSCRPFAAALAARTAPLLAAPLLTALLALAPASAQAQQIVIELDEERAAQLGLDTGALEGDLREQMDGQLRLDEVDQFLRQMGAANMTASRGMGADYASNPQRFVLGGGVGTAVNSAGLRFGKGSEGMPAGGFAFQAALLAGINLGIASKEESALRRFVLYVDGLVAETNPEPFHASTTNLGTHLQIKLARPKPAKGLLEWGGLDLTGGYEWSRYRLELAQELPVLAENLTWEADGELAVITDSASVPIELSTNLRFFIISAFFGAAADVALDSSTDLEMSLSGPILVDTNGGRENLGSATVSLERAGIIEGVTPRLFAGAQVNIFFVKAYGQVNVGLNDSFGGHIGGRIAM